MMTPEIQQLLDYADESHEAAKVLINGGFVGFSAAQSYYTMFYLAQALLLTRELRFSSHSAVIAAYGKEFSKTGLLASRPEIPSPLDRCRGKAGGWALRGE